MCENENLLELDAVEGDFLTGAPTYNFASSSFKLHQLIRHSLE
jgi:hypothetical protein